MTAYPIASAILLNAKKHWPRHRDSYAGAAAARARYEVDLHFVRKMIEELGEAAAALDGGHEHPLELELIQLGGIILNWSRARGISPAALSAALLLDDERHPAPEAAADLAPLDPLVLQDMLLLIDVRVPLDEVLHWTAEQRTQAEDYARACYLRASDNPVSVPARPAFLPRPQEVSS